GLICDLGSYACQLVAEYIDIKIQVDVTSLGLVDPLVTSLFHIPNPPAYAPQIGLPLTCKMNLLQRTLNVIVSYTFMTIFHYLMLGHMYAAANITSLGLQTPPTFYNRRSSILIANGDFALDYPRPVIPATKVVGPILPKPAKALPIHLQEFVSANPNGTIVMSFGSVVTGLKYITDVQMLFKSLGRLPYNVICKCSEKHKYSIPKNVMTFNWLLQNDLLGHPNIKGFVTHCGMNSILEAAYHGVPIVGIPIFGDQIVNAQKIVYRNNGVILDINEINSDDLYFGIMNATTDQWILGNASTVSKLIKNRLNGRTPVEEAADWIKFALNSKGGHYLRSEEYNLPWYQFYLFDIFAILCMMIIVTIIILKLIWRGIVFVFRRSATFSKAKQS
ncbi:UDP-glucuronosyltransferase 1-7C, partial [Trichoplax sp. H2]